MKIVQIRSFSGQYFLGFGLNTEIYSVNLRIQSKYGKYGPEKKLVFGQFSHTDVFKNSVNDKILYYISIANVTDILLNIFRLCFTSFKTSIFQSDY